MTEIIRVLSEREQERVLEEARAARHAELMKRLHKRGPDAVDIAAYLLFLAWVVLLILTLTGVI